MKKLAFQERLYDNKVDVVDSKTGEKNGTTSKENALKFISRSKENKSAKGKRIRSKKSKTKNKPTVQLIIDI